jgi:hypothetical protein
VVSLEFLLDRQLGSAFNTTAFDNGSACLGSNASTKAVGSRAVACVWLVGSLWHICSILLF